MKILGIDLSLTSPATCLFEGEFFNFEQCRFFYLTSNKKLQHESFKTTGTLFAEYNNDMQRYNFISKWVQDTVNYHNVEHVFIEGYSYSSTGKVFNIAENCGILKYNLWTSNVTYTVIPPTVVKKVATGRGNSNKAAMEISFLEETGFDLRKHLNLSASVASPVSDIIDSFYVTKSGLEYVKEK
jgi:Holliday junction resolvasome RuvABC endonuclease subunit